MTTHTCPAPNCNTELQHHIFACRKHWFAIPADLRSLLRSTWHCGDITDYSHARQMCTEYLEQHP